MPSRVLVCGAGPTGLTAAVELARLGHHVEIIEKREGPSQLSRAVGILPGSIDVLRPSGAADAILEEALRFAGAIFHDRSRQLARFPLNFDARSTLYGLAQDRTETHIADALSRLGTKVRYGAPLEGFTQDRQGVTARFDGREARFDYLLGADGVGSTVRQSLAIDYEGYDLPGRWSIADVESHRWPDHDFFKVYLLEAGNVAVVAPMGPARFRVIASRPDALDALPVAIRPERIHRTAEFTISVRQAARYALGHVYLAGDAAHSHSPFGGRGMNLGIADAAAFAARLDRDELAGYAAARRAKGTQVIRFSERGRKLFQSQSPWRRRALESLIWSTSRAPILSRAAMRFFTNA